MEGNQMKMREALVKLRAEIELFYNNEWIPYDAWQGCDDVISHALSAPARQCDVGTPEEQNRRFDNFCRGEDCKTCPCNVMPRCHMVWAQTPYEAQEGAGK